MKNFYVKTYGLLDYVTAAYAEALACEGVDDMQMIDVSVLMALYERDGLSATALAHSVGRAATSFTSTLDRLAERGLVERRPNPEDRRALFVHLTPAGEALRESIQKAFAEAEGIFSQGILDYLPLPSDLRVVGPLGISRPASRHKAEEVIETSI